MNGQVDHLNKNVIYFRVGGMSLMTDKLFVTHYYCYSLAWPMNFPRYSPGFLRMSYEAQRGHTWLSQI